MDVLIDGLIMDERMTSWTDELSLAEWMISGTDQLVDG